ncbi:MAG: hypothetical protein EOP47_14400 [Sphingobacteriaceae bacterium]|nr:MAG: hypothetical protein EOP47_14400 [Sphingobacteriaceae bacterium]
MKPKSFLPALLFIVWSHILHAAAPVITSFSPSSGPVGTLVTVNGSGLLSPTTFSIGGKPAIIISNTNTKLIGMVMPGAATGAVWLTTSEGSSAAAGNFTTTVQIYPDKQQGIKLTLPGTISDLSSHGNTAVVSSTTDNGNKGAVWIYLRTNDTWSQQGAKITPNDNSITSFGASPAISADGNTLVVGSPGAIWTFTRTNNVWSQLGTKLTGPGIIPIGTSIDLSADGKTLVSAGQKGMVIYVRSGSTWVQQGPVIPGYTSDTSNGFSKVKISADGNTIVASHTLYAYFSGATWIYVRNGNNWTEQFQFSSLKVISYTPAYQGSSLAISADGNTVVIASAATAMAWVLNRTGTTWTEATMPLMSPLKTAYNGANVSMNDAGTIIALCGKNNSVMSMWLFTFTGNGWAQQGDPLPTDANVYTSAQLSADGYTLIRSQNEPGGSGALVYIPGPAKVNQTINFTLPKTVFEFDSPDIALSATSTSGLPVTFTIVTDKGDNPSFDIINNKLHIQYGGTAVVTAQQTGNAIYNAAPPVTYVIKTNNGPALTSFSPSSGPVGTLVTVNGSGFAGTTGISIGGKPATIISISDTKLVGMVMPGAVNGPLSVTIPGGTSTTTGSFTVTATPYPGKQQFKVERATANLPDYTFSDYVSADISADGNTAIVGSIEQNGGKGAALILVRNNGVWSQQGPALIPTSNLGSEKYGRSVAISADGNLAVVYGAGIWTYVRNNGNWVQWGSKIVTEATNPLLALSADGKTLALAGWYTKMQIYVITPYGWKADSNIPGHIMDPYTGSVYVGYSSIDISADGNTIIGGHYGEGFGENVWIHTRNGNTWKQQLVMNGGPAVGISAGGNTAVIQSGSLTVILNRQGTTWVAEKVPVYLEGGHKQRASLSTDGNTLAVTGVNTSVQKDPAYIWFANRTSSGWAQQGNTINIPGLKNTIAGALSADGSTYIGLQSAPGRIITYAYGPSAAKQNQTITVTPPKTTFTYGDPEYTLSATSSSGLPVTYTVTNNPDTIRYDGSTKVPAPPAFTLINNKLRVIGSGRATVTILQKGNDTYNAALPVSFEIISNKLGLEVTVNNMYTVVSYGIQFSSTIKGLINNDKVRIKYSSTAGLEPAAGKYPVIADSLIAQGNGYNADERYYIKKSTPGILTVYPLSVMNPITKTFGDSDFYLFGIETPGAIYYTTNPAVATIVNGKVHITGLGQSTITINSGNFVASKKLTVIPAKAAFAVAEPQVNSALSPNGDGHNDVLHISNIETYPDNSLAIMNTNGIQVFSATGYDNTTKAFNGYSSAGKLVKPGTYFYRLQYSNNGLLKNKTGFIVVKY